MKGKINAEVMKEFLLDHGEKFVFAIFVLVFCGVVWSSVSVKGITKAPGELQKAVDSAKEHLKSEKVPPISIVDFDKMAKMVTEPIKLGDLGMSTPWITPLFPQRKMREQPTVFPVENLTVASGRSAVSRAADPSASSYSMYDDEEEGPKTPRSSTRGIHWNVIMGVIPYHKQLNAYKSALGTKSSSLSASGAYASYGGGSSTNPQNEPTYYTYSIERAEVPADGNMSDLTWEPFQIDSRGENYKIAKEINALPVGSRGTAFSIQVSPNAEGAEAYLPPPLMAYENLVPTGSTSTTSTDNRGLKERAGISFLNPLPPISNYGNYRLNWLKVLKFPEGINIGKPKPRGAVQKASDARVAAGHPADEEDDFVGEETSNSRLTGVQMIEKAPQRLFVFVDYTALPGVTYTYRVKLRLHNPNFNYKPTTSVANEEITKARYLDSDWSAPSPPAYMERNERILAGTMRLGEDTKQAPTPSLMLVLFDVETGADLSCLFETLRKEPPPPPSSYSTGIREQPTKRPPAKKKELGFLNGQLLTFRTVPSQMNSLDNSRSYTSYSPGGGLQEEDEQEYPSGYVLLDMKKGRELYRALREDDRFTYAEAVLRNRAPIYTPARVILLGPDGKMVIQSELADMEEVYSRQKDTGYMPVPASSSTTKPTSGSGKPTTVRPPTPPPGTKKPNQYGGSQLTK